MTESKTATIYRMVMPSHICPWGLKSVDLLRRNGFKIDDHHLETREQTDAFMDKEGVKTTPQTYIDGKRVGGYDDLRRYFGLKVHDPDAVSYRPVITVFVVAALLALAITWAGTGTFVTLRSFEWFIALSMCLLAMLKLQDVETFSTMFLNYDLLARRFVPYSYVYPYAELAAGVLMVAGVLNFISIPVALFIGVVGAVSVFRAVYIDKRELKCACVGGSSKTPLGFVSLTENLMMIVMAVWMLVVHGLI